MSTAKGTAFESAAARWLRENGFPLAERRAKTGRYDRGDITGVPGVVVECKDAVQLRLHKWSDETEMERANDDAEFGVLLVKRSGTSSVGRAYAIMSPVKLFGMIRELQELRAEVPDE